MQMLRTFFWVITAVIVVVFAMANWNSVDVLVWPNTILQTKLPVLVLGAYALGMIPLWLVYRASRWNLTRRLENAERQLADVRQQQAVATNSEFTGNPLPTTVTSLEAPI